MQERNKRFIVTKNELIAYEGVVKNANKITGKDIIHLSTNDSKEFIFYETLYSSFDIMKTQGENVKIEFVDRPNGTQEGITILLQNGKGIPFEDYLAIRTEAMPKTGHYLYGLILFVWLCWAVDLIRKNKFSHEPYDKPK